MPSCKSRVYRQSKSNRQTDRQTYGWQWLCCIISETKWNIGWKSRFFHTPAFDAPIRSGGRLVGVLHFVRKNENGVAIKQREKSDDMYSHFNTISAWWTEGQTEGGTDGWMDRCTDILQQHSQRYAICIALHGKR